ncbi:MAG: type II secretion system F family protein, partial [Elusimicrobia bacterium]|nr:type II secretion system F family protein [Elusimicrobiota bacterium]
MRKYSYLAMADGSKMVDGFLEADTFDSATETLTSQGFLVLSIREAASPLWGGLFGRFLKTGEVQFSVREQSVFCRDLAMLLEGGLPLVRALWLVGRSARDPATAQLLRDLSEHVAKGKPLSRSMAHFPAAFSSQLVAMLEVGEASGNVPVVLRQFSVRLEREHKLSARVRTALLYPTLVVVVAVALTLYLSIAVVPTFAKIFEDFNIQLPWITKAVVGFSGFLTQYMVTLAGSAVALAALLRGYLLTEDGRRWFSALKLRVPIFRTLFESELIERFFANMALMLASGVSVLQSLQVLE